MADLTTNKIFLIILDGFGLASEAPDNAITLAKMPYVNSLIAGYPSMPLVASSLVVGLPWGQYGNSEVGHSAIGAGRIIVQDLSRINSDIKSGVFFENKVILQACEHVEKNRSTLHFIGCISPGGIHSHEDHLFALLDLAKRRGLTKVAVHFITDGQDTGPQDAIKILERLTPHLATSGAVIASVSGRTFAMDRVLNWQLTEKVWHAMVNGDGPPIDDVAHYLTSSYERGVFDHDIEPATVVADGKPVAPIGAGDAVLFFNFRNDRMVQLVQPFAVKMFDGFIRTIPNDLFIATMTRYADEFGVPVAYEALDIPHTLGEIVSAQNWQQFRIAEKEKEAHVTNFFNGGRISPFPGEERIIVSSRMLKGKGYLEHPEMSADKVVQAALERLNSPAKFFVINFANPDMIGHAGNLEAAVRACEVVDASLQELIPQLINDPTNVVILTADHGNAEEMMDPKTGGEDTQHSTRPVPAVFIGQAFAGQGTGLDLIALANQQPLGTLVDVAPTVLKLFGLEQPAEMTGSSLL